MNRIFNFILIIFLCCFIFAGFLAVPAAVSAAELSWSVIESPNITDGQLVVNSNIDVFAVSPSGTVMLAYDNTTHLLHKSSSSGVKWTSDNIGNGLEGTTVLPGDLDGSGVVDADDDVVDIVFSPAFEQDSRIFAAINKKVFYSPNAGVDFYEAGTNVGGLPAAGASITSMDFASSYYDAGTIIIGTSDGANNGGIYTFNMNSASWTDMLVGDWDGNGVVDDSCDVLDVAFSPDVQTDAGIIAFVTYNDGSDKTVVTGKSGNVAWGSNPSNVTVIAGQKATGGELVILEGFDWDTANNVVVGTSGTTIDDVFLVRKTSTSTTLNDLNCKGTTVETDVYSLAVMKSGSYNKVLVSQTNSNYIIYTKTLLISSTSDPIWYENSKAPTGTKAIVSWSSANANAYAATTGAGSALSRSTDSGANWNQIGMIDISAVTLAIVDFAIVDENNLFVIMWDDVDVSNTFSTGDNTMVFRTTNGGTEWEQVLSHLTVTNEAMTTLRLSPNYSTDKALFVVRNDTRIWKTNNSGNSFTGYAAPAPITAFLVVNQSTYYTGHINAIYKSSRTTASPTLDGNTVTSISMAPNKSTIFLGTNSGSVYMSTDDARTFSVLGDFGSLGGTVASVQPDPAYSSNKTVYAGSANPQVGVSRWVVGKSTRWEQIDDDSNTLSCTGIAFNSEGVLYAASNTNDKGMRRVLIPSGDITAMNPVSAVMNLPGGARITKLESLSDSQIVAIAADLTNAGEYGYHYRIISFTDTVIIAPAPSFPDDDVSVAGRFTLQWNPVPSPYTVYYRCQIAQDPDFLNLVSTVITKGTSVTIQNLLTGERYWWRVSVESIDVDINRVFRSKNSEGRSFSIELPTPELKSPGYGATETSLRPGFSWVPVPGATSYDLELSDNLDYENAWVENKLIHAVWGWEKDLEYSKSYYWRVRAVKSRENGADTTSKWSEGVFTTGAAQVEPLPEIIVDTIEFPPPEPAKIEIPALPLNVRLPEKAPPPPPALSTFHMRTIIIIYSLLGLEILVLLIISRKISMF